MRFRYQPNNQNTSSPFFTVIVPVFNKEPHIFRSVNSVLNQSFSNFELIIVDDGSTDDSLKEINKFKDSRVIVLENLKPTGPSAARNTGVRHAKGDWVSFLDADDEWASFYLQKVYEGIQSYPEVSIVSSGYNISKGNNMLNQDTYYSRNFHKGVHIYDIKTFLGGPRPICTSVATIKKDLLMRSGGFDEKFRHGEDVELWLRLLLIYEAKGLWLSYMGATYHMDSVNMVTSQKYHIEPAVYLTIKDLLSSNNEIATDVRKLLKVYSNNRFFKIAKQKVFSDSISSKIIYKELFWNELKLRHKLFFLTICAAPLNLKKKIFKIFTI